MASGWKVAAPVAFFQVPIMGDEANGFDEVSRQKGANVPEGISEAEIERLSAAGAIVPVEDEPEDPKSTDKSTKK